MKVTVSFGSVRVVVPCGDGDLLVRDLMDKAITRYKKATGKPSGSWVMIHNLKSVRDGGILDADDQLNDVADDREQLIAAFEEQGLPYLPQNFGDGTSTTSSVGTESPDIFQGNENKMVSDNDVEITVDTIPSGIMPLQVRRGSEPALNRLSPIPIIVSDPMKRWSAAATLDDEGPDSSTPVQDFGPDRVNVASLWVKEESKEEKSSFTRLSRDSGRLSILGNNPEMYRWAEAADRQLFKFQSRRESEESFDEKVKDDNSPGSDDGLIIITNEGGPLGIHVVPDYDESGRDMGLIIQGIEPGGRIDRDGRLHVHDRIIEINSQSLLNINFQKAQEIFKDALQTSEIRLKLVKENGKTPPPPVLPKPRIHKDQMVNGLHESIEIVGSNANPNVATKVATIAPTKKTVVSVAPRNSTAIIASNTRKIGKKIHIKLTKGPEGLGFSITTRDNPAGGNCPIYIKNILPKGAAIQDGSLKPGDRLLEVNGIEMTGKSQTEAVTILRNTPLGGIVNLVVSRQEAESPKLPRELVDTRIDTNHAITLHVPSPSEKSNDDGIIFPWKHREIMTFDIPLNDTGSAGLGVSVKGKTSTGSNGTVDLGIFVKSVITGGAASKDGRLRENDQLVNVNGVSLLGKSNSQAMETLRKAIQQDGPNPGAISLTIARRITGTSNVTSEQSRPKASDDNKKEDQRITVLEQKTSNDFFNDLVGLPQWAASRIMADEDKNFDTHDTIQKIEDKDLGFDVPLRNPVIDRLMGNRVVSLRNESYYRATQDWNDSPKVDSPEQHHMYLQRMGSMASPTVNMTMDDNSVIIEDEYPGITQHNNKIAPNDPPKDGPNQGKDKTEGSKSQNENDATYVSQVSLEEAGVNFSRDGFGRQSMSEKRHAHLDARNTDTYQRNKKAREEREKKIKSGELENNGDDAQGTTLNNHMMRANSADSLLSLTRSNRSSVDLAGKDVGPALGMKKSSSLESLQTMVAEAEREEDEDNFARPSVRAVRSRGCNESFRAAVDRSYEVPMGDAMETLDEESESGSSGLGRGNSRQSSLSGELAPDEVYRYGKKGKRKGILKGLGSVFKFGKNRKLPNDQLPRLTMQDLERQKLESERQRARKAAQDEQERIQEQYRKLLQRQIEQQQQQQQQNDSVGINNNTKEDPLESHNRHNRISQLRAQHQRKHMERLGQYPGDEQEEKLERQLCDQVDRQKVKSRGLRKRYESEVIHTRSHSYDLYKEKDRSSNHAGYGDSNKYSHYVNYEEIQQHLRQQQQEKKQQSSRERTGPQDRPISSYFEYESISGVYKAQPVPETSTNSLPRRTHHSTAHPQLGYRPSAPQQKSSMTNPYTSKELPKMFHSTSSTYDNYAVIKSSSQPHSHIGSSKYAIVNHHNRDTKNPGSKV